MSWFRNKWCSKCHCFDEVLVTWFQWLLLSCLASEETPGRGIWDLSLVILSVRTSVNSSFKADFLEFVVPLKLEHKPHSCFLTTISFHWGQSCVCKSAYIYSFSESFSCFWNMFSLPHFFPHHWNGNKPLHYQNYCWHTKLSITL